MGHIYSNKYEASDGGWGVLVCSGVGKPGTASQFQRRELVAVPALRRAHRSAFSRESLPDGGPWDGPRYRLIDTGANRVQPVQPANSKGGNWWQSPLCGAHTDRHDG